MSDILVDTIDDFAYRMRISEVFTSLVILPFFSNIGKSSLFFLMYSFRDTVHTSYVTRLE